MDSSFSLRSLSSRLVSLSISMSRSYRRLDEGPQPSNRRGWRRTRWYERDIEMLKETNRELSGAATEKLESIAAAYDRLAADYQVEKTEAERYDEIAKLLAASLDGVRNDDGSAAMHYDARRGVWTMATDLLFDSGSFTISPKGLEILKKFGDAYKTQDSASGSSATRQRAIRLQRDQGAARHGHEHRALGQARDRRLRQLLKSGLKERASSRSWAWQLQPVGERHERRHAARTAGSRSSCSRAPA